MITRGGRHALVAGAVLVALLLTGATGLAVGASPPTYAGPAQGIPGTWASYDTGRVNVVLPAALPQVELFQDANSSVRATLQVDQIVELAPGGLPHPHIVAAALAQAVHGFNGSATTNASSWPISLSAELEVRPANETLWSTGPAAAVPVGGALGLSVLTITYALIDNRSASAGVSVNWSVSDWPWVASSDLLAIELHFNLASGRQVTACAGEADPDAVPTGCTGTSLGPQGISWGSGYNALEGAGGSGPAASLGWNASAQLPWGAGVPYTVGAYSTGNGSAELLLGAPAHGASTVAGGVDFSLVVPVTSEVSRIAADPAAFGGGLVVVTVASALGLALYRRRDKRLREEL